MGVEASLLGQATVAADQEHQDQEHQEVEASLLGQATVAAGLSPQQGLEVYEALRQAREGLSLVDECHLLFQLTPVRHRLRPDDV